MSDSPPGDPRYAQAWVNTERRPIGQLKAIGSTMVGLIAESRGLLVVGIDPVTGHERWHRSATPATVTIGVVVSVTKIGDDKVAYFRPLTNVGFAQLVVADAQTGRDLAVTPPGLFTTLPVACMHDQDACVLSRDGPGGKTRQYRLEVATGSYLVDSEDLRLGARLLDESGVIDLGDRPGNTLGWLRDGKLQWTIRSARRSPPGSPATTAGHGTGSPTSTSSWAPYSGRRWRSLRARPRPRGWRRDRRDRRGNRRGALA